MVYKWPLFWLLFDIDSDLFICVWWDGGGFKTETISPVCQRIDSLIRRRLGYNLKFFSSFFRSLISVVPNEEIYFDFWLKWTKEIKRSEIEVFSDFINYHFWQYSYTFLTMYYQTIKEWQICTVKLNTEILRNFVLFFYILYKINDVNKIICLPKISAKQK